MGNSQFDALCRDALSTWTHDDEKGYLNEWGHYEKPEVGFHESGRRYVHMKHSIELEDGSTFSTVITFSDVRKLTDLSNFLRPLSPNDKALVLKLVKKLSLDECNTIIKNALNGEILLEVLRNEDWDTIERMPVEWLIDVACSHSDQEERV